MIDYSFSYGSQTLRDKLDLMNAADYDVWNANCQTKPWNLERIGPHGQPQAPHLPTLQKKRPRKEFPAQNDPPRKRSRTKLVRSIKRLQNYSRRRYGTSAKKKSD